MIDHDTFTGDITKGYSSFFQNSDEDNCPIKKCTLFKSGCTDPYLGTNLIMVSESPFVIQQGPTVTAGEAEKVCI